MLGYIKPKKLREISRKPDPDGGYAYVFEYYDEASGEYLPMPDIMCTSEADAQVRIADSEWDGVIKEDLRELGRLRDELIATEAVIGARIDRIIRQLGDIPEDEELPDEIGGMSYEAFCDMQEYDEELRRKIQALDAKEERIKRVLSERKWDSGLPAKRNRHIDFHGRVLFDKKEQLYYVDLDKETDCITKRVTGKTLEELGEKISIENDRLRVRQGVIPEGGSVNSNWTILMAKRGIARLSAAETRHLLELYNFAIFGSEIDRKAAREKIFEMLGLNNSLEKINDLERRKKAHMINEAKNASNAKWDRYTFSSYILNYLDSEDMTKQELADRIGVNRSTITRYTYGDTVPDKANARKLAAAMGLSVTDMCVFINSAGYFFPNEDDAYDMGLIEAVSTPGHTWIDLLAALGVGEDEEKGDDEKEAAAGRKAERKHKGHNMNSDR